MTDQFTGGVRATVARTPRAGNDFTDLAKIIGSSGLMRRRYGYYWTKLIGAVVVLAAALVAFFPVSYTHLTLPTILLV